MAALPAPGRFHATYRVQLRPGFGFDEVAELAGYLADLGVSHLYASPYLQAAQGSTHGYDVVDPTRVNEELGGAPAHARMSDALGAAGLGQVLDVVPNHMAITGRDNVWWWDVLENGPSSVYAAYFDVDWDPPESKLRNTVLLPILGDHYGRILEAGQLRLSREGGSFVVCYFDHAAPIAPRSLDTLLEAGARRLPTPALDEPLGPNDLPNSRQQLESVATALNHLPPSWATDRQSVRERHRDKEVLRSRLAELCEQDPAVAAAIDAEVEAINADPDQLDALLERQNFRLAWWKIAGQELDYRRFFDITSLVGLNVEDDQVFADSHALVLEFLTSGVLDGVRIDHVDGLRDPAGYLHRLARSAPRAWIVVEKILQPDETLPDDWPVAGTTGYDWLNLAGGLLIDPDGHAGLVEAYGHFTGEPVDFPEVAYVGKRQVLRDALATDVNRLTELLARICDRHRRYRDYTRRDLYTAVAEVAANFPVYRTYVTPGHPPRPMDVVHVEAAVKAAQARRPDIDGELLEFFRDVLLLRVPGEAEEELALRFPQLTSPVMAKGVEDTAFYRYLPLVAANEVGGHPERPAVAVADFHESCEVGQRLWPVSMLTTSTHDTKRSEDVRARISLLSEMPVEWGAIVERWWAHNRAEAMIDRKTEWLIYETLVGAWPIDRDRLVAYLEKAIREAKTHTSWTDPQPAYEAAIRQFAEGLLEDAWLVGEVEALVSRLRRPGWVNSLALKLLTLTGPGVADLYQGSELWDFSLVDPDNRRPVDFDVRRRLLGRLSSLSLGAAWAEEGGSGLSKMGLVTHALAVRRERPECFGAGNAGCYGPLVTGGWAQGHVVAFTRGSSVVTVVPRLPLALARRGGWEDTTVTLPDGEWGNRLGSAGSWSGTVAVRDLLADFPVALLVRS